MSLTSMKRKRDKTCDETVSCSPGSDFPYGLRINLEDDDLKKLGIKTLPKAGEEMIVVGVGPVVNINVHEDDQRKDRSISIQLESIEVGPRKEMTAEDAVSDAIKDV